MSTRLYTPHRCYIYKPLDHAWFNTSEVWEQHGMQCICYSNHHAQLCLTYDAFEFVEYTFSHSLTSHERCLRSMRR